MAGYDVLNKLPAEAFLDPANFATEYDIRDGSNFRANAQYRKGLEISNNSACVIISAGSVWSSVGKDGSHTMSYEGIGYHAHTASLLRGFLDGSASVIVYRRSDDGTIIKTIIRPANT